MDLEIPFLVLKDDANFHRQLETCPPCSWMPINTAQVNNPCVRGRDPKENLGLVIVHM